ncbi:DUF5666 domain-containing protein [Patescibacteria group bacterium]
MTGEKKHNQNNYLPVVVLVVLAAGVGFLGGKKYQQSKTPSRADFQRRMGASHNGGMMGQTAGTEVVRGEVISQDGQTVTVKLQDESSKLVLVSQNTAINKASQGSVEDLEAGQQVMIFGQKNEDGSVSATSIQVGMGFRSGMNEPGLHDPGN